ncbi:MAG: response regulator transcription factor [Peptoniphilaceae bacterium]
MYKILVIEDDMALNRGIQITLANKEKVVESAFSKKEALNKLNINFYDLIILDLNLPDGKGIDILKNIRRKNNVPVIILTANDLEMDEVIAFDLGANDYITKPFSLAILKARVANQLKNKSRKIVYRKDDLYFNFNEMKFYKDSIEFELSKIEQRLLYYLIENRGIKLRRESIMSVVWDSSDYVTENALSVAIKRLRDKIEDNSEEYRYIKTVYGIGYYWDGD